MRAVLFGVLALGLAACEPPGDLKRVTAEAGPFLCRGAEPFFILELDAEAGALSQPTDDGGVEVVFYRGAWAAAPADATRTWRGTAPGGRLLVASVAKAACIEPSGEARDHALRAELNDARRLEGCCVIKDD